MLKKYYIYDINLLSNIISYVQVGKNIKQSYLELELNNSCKHFH